MPQYHVHTPLKRPVFHSKGGKPAQCIKQNVRLASLATETAAGLRLLIFGWPRKWLHIYMNMKEIHSYYADVNYSLMLPYIHPIAYVHSPICFTTVNYRKKESHGSFCANTKRFVSWITWIQQVAYHGESQLTYALNRPRTRPRTMQSLFDSPHSHEQIYMHMHTHTHYQNFPDSILLILLIFVKYGNWHSKTYVYSEYITH